CVKNTLWRIQTGSIRRIIFLDDKMAGAITKISHNKPVFSDNDSQEDLITLNLGPTHPATHGVFQNVLQMDGERIVSGVSTIGYIHRAFEKIAEHRPFYQITPLTDRLNYCSSPINNMG